MERQLWQVGEMEKCLARPMEGLRGIRFVMENFAALLFPIEDIDSLEIYHPRRSSPHRSPKYVYAEGGANIRLRPSADNLKRFGGLYDGPDARSPKGRYLTPFERIMISPDIVDCTLFYKRPWLYYDDAWDDDVAKCIVVYVPYVDKDRAVGNLQNVLQESWIDSEGCLNIVVRSKEEKGE